MSKTSILNSLLFLLYILLNQKRFAYAKEAATCIEMWEVGKEGVVIDLTHYSKSCFLQVTTSEEHMLSFRYLEGELSALRDIVKIHDGLELQATLVPLEEKKLDEQYETLRKTLLRPVITRGNSALIEIIREAPIAGHLKIQRAVECPFNLGAGSQCGDILQDGSCYCATYTARSWEEQKNFCERNGFKLLSIESALEEDTVYASWGKAMYFWTSLTDMITENYFVWNSTGIALNPGYTNWHPNQPDGSRSCDTLGHDCVHLNYLNGGWNDAPCTLTYEAICEKHPV